MMQMSYDVFILSMCLHLGCTFQSLGSFWRCKYEACPTSTRSDIKQALGIVEALSIILLYAQIWEPLCSFWCDSYPWIQHNVIKKKNLGHKGQLNCRMACSIREEKRDVFSSRCRECLLASPPPSVFAASCNSLSSWLLHDLHFFILIFLIHGQAKTIHSHFRENALVT